MLKLARYVKKYLVLFVVAVFLLVGQAMLDLNLPNMMSKIVNIGIQQSGIEEQAPKAVAPGTFSALTLFMSEDDFLTAYSAYTPFAELSPRMQDETLKTFPDAETQNALVLTAGEEERAAVDKAFARADYALTTLLTETLPQGGTTPNGSDAQPDLNKLFSALASLGLNDETLQNAVDRAAHTPDAVLSGASAAMNKAIYTQLGADTGHMQMTYIWRIGGIMVLITLAIVACAIGAGFGFARAGAGIARDLRRDIFSKVLAFSNTEMDSFSTSSLITRTTNDVTQVQMMYTMGLRMLVFAPIMGIGGIIMALRKSPDMSWIIAAAVLILLVTLVVLIKVVMPRFKIIQKLVDRLNQVARENLSGIMVVRAFSNQQFQEDRFEKANADLTKNNLFTGRAMVLLAPIMMLVMNGMSLFIIWFGADQIAASSLQIGDLMAFIQYAMQVVMSFLFIAFIFVILPRASVSAERIDEVLRSESTITDPEIPALFHGEAHGELAFHNVSFRYEGADECALQNISFTARPGQTTAIIGATGSGKSTLVSLIPRFYDVSEGSITLDGVDIRQLSQQQLRELVAYVPQKSLLFSGTIASNLRYGRQNATHADLQVAAEVAQAAEFINELPDGYNSPVSQGGTNFSGGQRQRLAIARALVKKAPVYIFDDSFSALDFATDARLRAALKPYTRDSAILLVAQRVSTIMQADQIIVLEDGAMVGCGTHRELLNHCPAYREIAQSQMSEEELA